MMLSDQNLLITLSLVQPLSRGFRVWKFNNAHEIYDRHILNKLSPFQF